MEQEWDPNLLLVVSMLPRCLGEGLIHLLETSPLPVGRVGISRSQVHRHSKPESLYSMSPIFIFSYRTMVCGWLQMAIAGAPRLWDRAHLL